MNYGNNSNRRYVIITPVRDEEHYLEETIRSVVNQTVKPAEWVIVNDGSSDGTPAIIDKHAAQYDWIRGVHRANRGFRKSGGGVIEAFNEGYGTLLFRDWNFVVKLDGDLTFEADYFERILELFASEKRLGIAGGTLYHPEKGEMRIERNPQFHVRGATKIYRRECWEQIGGLHTAPGWDTIDEVKANMLGWKTMSIPDIFASHHRPTGGADGTWRDSVKHGLACYITGYHPLFVLASSFYRFVRKPYSVGFAGSFCGFLWGYLSRVHQINDPALIRFVRQQQIRRLTGQETIWR